MLDARSLRGRLTLAYASALAVALVVFGIVSIVLLDSVQRQTLDEELASTSAAALAIIDTEDFTIEFDAQDKAQFSQIVGLALGGAILARDGSVVASNATKVPRSVAAFASRLEGQDRLATIGAGADRYRVRVRRIEGPRGPLGVLALWRPTQYIAALDLRVGALFALVIPGLALVAVLVGGLIARRGLAPLEDVGALASEIEARDLSRRLSIEGAPDELERLCSAFNRMLDRLEAAFARQKQFTADASHELRSPLSVIRAEADLALLREREGGEYRRTLEAIAREADTLEELTRDLLVLARAEAVEPSADDRVDLAAIAARVAERLRPLAAERGIALSTRLAAAEVTEKERLAERLVTSLLDNALKHATSGGRVDLSVAPHDDVVDLIVRDDGFGFTAAALEHGTQRFWRDGASRDREGTGLGLAIAAAIVHHAGGEITLNNAAVGGAEVRVRLPLATARTLPSAAQNRPEDVPLRPATRSV